MQHDPHLTIPAQMWKKLLSELHHRTGNIHESGAFLLGRMADADRQVEEIVYYDDLDPTAYRTGIVVLNAPVFSALWGHCQCTRRTIVADLHVHPKRAFQSHTDRTNPMIALSAHLALIVPNFARLPVILPRLGFYEYHGQHQWRD